MALLDQYVNDRPYAASSFLSVALNKTLRTAMTGVSKDRQELADADIPLEAVVTPLPLRGGEALVRALFEPLGWTVDLTPVEGVGSAVGAARYGHLKLSGVGRLSALLNHLYVLIPVMDDAKHYWVGEAEIDKLMAKGEGWLDGHPARDLIVRRYLRNRGALARLALERLAPETSEEALAPEARVAAEEALEAPIRLNDLRMDAVVQAIRATGGTIIADLGCGEGKLLYRLVREHWVQRLIGLDPAARELEWAAKRLKLNQFGGPPEGRVTLLHGSLTYRDSRWAEADVAALVEVIEHVDEDRLPLIERIVFGETAPKSVIVTTPNADYNALFPNLAAGAFPPSRSQIRMEPRAVRGLGYPDRRDLWLHRRLQRHRRGRPCARRPHPDGGVHAMREPDKTDLAIPDFALVVLIGSTGSGKSTFAAKHFLPTEVISSDRCRALVSDDETDQGVSADAFDLVREIAGKRLKHRKLTVIDATNVRAADRKAWVELARKWHALPSPSSSIPASRSASRATP
jgi:3' terminal RNA ribose 2'-O-methyltransferase Hen1